MVDKSETLMHLHLSKRPRKRKELLVGFLRRREGVALLSVLTVVTVSTVVVLMYLSLANNELVSSNHYALGLRAQGMAESATNVVIGQIRRATEEAETVWASQPGAVRTYDQSGEFSRGYKLFSDDAMQALTAEDLVQDLPAADWDSIGQEPFWVDLNAPLIRGSEIYYPIAHPGALDRGVEGFSHIKGMVSKGTGEMPMPVRWLYMLEDGTLGSLDDSLSFVAAPGYGGRKPTKDNPISGRIAFWTDDESCKINVNTASEPTPWDVPRAGGTKDRNYGKHQPAKREFQRFPGHPATTALSPVLMPGGNEGEPLTPEQKASIYALVPRVATGGSKSATKKVSAMSKFGGVRLDLDRLLPSVDELAFRSNRAADVEAGLGGPRKTARLPGTEDVDSEEVERILRQSRFFLTTHSRAPEVNAFDLPRISMWPTASEAETKQGKLRTPFDDMMRFCATMGGEEERFAYHFERFNSRSSSDDYDFKNVPRNSAVFNYMASLVGRKVPGYGGTLASKWGIDRPQIMVEIFDYIRCTNLYDDQLKPRAYPLKEYDKGKHTQYTEGRPRSASLSSWPGHGQVVPIEIPVGMTTYRGFGRFYTISEAGILMICCGDAGGPKDFADPGAGPEFPKGIMASNQPGTGMGSNKALPRELSWEADKQERCVQAALLFELFCPSQGWTHLNEDITIEVEVVNAFTVDGERIKFHLDKDVWQSAGEARIGGRRMGSVGEASSSTMAGGTVGFWALADDRRAPAREPLLEDRDLQPRSSRERSDEDRRVYPFISEPFIVNGDDDTMSMGSAEIEVRIRLGTAHSPDPEPMASRPIVQTLSLKFPETTLPVPILAQDRVYSAARPEKNDGGEYDYTLAKRQNSKGQHVRRRGGVLHPSYWWTLNRDGPGIGVVEHKHANWAFWRDVGAPSDWEPSYEGDKFVATEEQFNGRHYGRLVNFSNPYWTLVNRNPRYRGKDVVRTLVPEHRDYRLIAALGSVPSSAFVPHRDYHNEDVYLAHHFSGVKANALSGRGYRGSAPGLVDALDEENPRERRSRYYPDRKPDFPVIDGDKEGEVKKVQKYGDFDNGIGILTDGAYINKPDEGNRLSRERKAAAGSTWWTIPYFHYASDDQGGAPGFFSPNRQVPSPVMFGSLPTGVMRNQPWETLLFRPQPGHPGDARPPGNPSGGGGRGTVAPPDHVLLDLFWMPVVEPYAISEPFSTAGKVNLNYQILPFVYMERDTALRAVLKSEEILAIPLEKAWDYKRGSGNAPLGELRRPIDMEETLVQFRRRFDRGELFRMASEVCDLHLVPEGVTLDEMEDDFWERHALTGDNSRERPYANLYPRVTTQSNIYRVHMRTQVIKKSRDSAPDRFDPELDVAVAEYRGSSLIERYIDPNDPEIPDYAADPSTADTLSAHYRFRVISHQRFAP